MALTDLTGTKWEIKNPIPHFSSGYHYEFEDLLFISNGQNFNRMFIDPSTAIDRYLSYSYYDNDTFVTDILVYYNYQQPNDECIWADEAYRTIEIIGGADATNSDLISWLQDSAIQILPILSVSYNNTEIKSMTDYGTFTLNTKGKFCQYDIVLSFGESGEGSQVNLISFTIEGVEYQAEEGMTWEEWVESEYNTDGFYVIGTKIRLASWDTKPQPYSLARDYAYVQTDEIIIHNMIYYKSKTPPSPPPV